MTFKEKVDYLSERFPADQVHGYFDAVSPTINDHVRRTMPGKNHHVVATRRR